MNLSRWLLLAIPVCGGFLIGTADPSQAWVRCSGEGETCVMPRTTRQYVRYGDGQNFFIMEVRGIDRLGCNNGVFGDPARGRGKSCDYMPAPADRNVWRGCAKEGETCRLPDNTPRLVAYGADSRWVYKIQSGSVGCNNGQFPDVAHGATKSCQYAAEPFPLAPGASFQDCGTEGTHCPASNGLDTVLLRYGAGASWRYRLTGAPNVACNNDTMGDPAPGQTKFCQVASLPVQITSVVGRWESAGSCYACSTLSRNVQVGMSGTRSETVTNSLARTISSKIESSLTFDKLGGVKGEISSSRTVTEAKAVMDALTRQTSETMTATCTPVARAQKLEMFQWKVDVDELCFVQGGQCRSTISQFRILCAAEQPSSYKPICPPSACQDALCTQCQE